MTEQPPPASKPGQTPPPQPGERSDNTIDQETGERNALPGDIPEAKELPPKDDQDIPIGPAPPGEGPGEYDPSSGPVDPGGPTPDLSQPVVPPGPGGGFVQMFITDPNTGEVRAPRPEEIYRYHTDEFGVEWRQDPTTGKWSRILDNVRDALPGDIPEPKQLPTFAPGTDIDVPGGTTPPPTETPPGDVVGEPPAEAPAGEPPVTTPVGEGQPSPVGEEGGPPPDANTRPLTDDLDADAAPPSRSPGCKTRTPHRARSSHTG